MGSYEIGRGNPFPETTVPPPTRHGHPNPRTLEEEATQVRRALETSLQDADKSAWDNVTDDDSPHDVHPLRKPKPTNRIVYSDDYEEE
jgi:hypothetical protein